MTTKVCSKCKVEKDLGEFYNCTVGKGGKRPYCKLCSIGMRGQWYADPTEQAKSEAFERYTVAREHVRLVDAKRMCEEKTEKRRATARKWNKENAEKRKVIAHNYYVKNPEKKRAAARRWYADKKELAKVNGETDTRTLTDSYVMRLLKLSVAPQELIELKRIQLRIHREIYKKGDVEA